MPTDQRMWNQRPRHAKPPTPSRRLLAVGSPTKAIRSFPKEGTGLTEIPILVLFDRLIITRADLARPAQTNAEMFGKIPGGDRVVLSPLPER
jgi:hypothetical protein